MPPFAGVLIETSGLADPAPIMQTFSTDRALGGGDRIDVVLAVVDAINGGSSSTMPPRRANRSFSPTGSLYRRPIWRRRPPSSG